MRENMVPSKDEDLLRSLTLQNQNFENYIPLTYVENRFPTELPKNHIDPCPNRRISNDFLFQRPEELLMRSDLIYNGQYNNSKESIYKESNSSSDDSCYGSLQHRYMADNMDPDNSSSPADTCSNPDSVCLDSYQRASVKSSKDPKYSPSNSSCCDTPKVDKKYSHNIVEKRYRQSINSCLGELQQMLFVSGTRCTKSNTLRAAIKRIKQLESVNSLLSEDNAMLRSTLKNYEMNRDMCHPIVSALPQQSENINSAFMFQQIDSNPASMFLNSIHPMAFAKQAYSFSYSFTILVLCFFLIFPVFAYNLSISEYFPSFTFQSDYAYRIKSGFLVNFVILAWLRFNRLSVVGDSLQSDGFDGKPTKQDLLDMHDKKIEKNRKRNYTDQVYCLTMKKLSLYGVLSEDSFDLASIIRSMYDVMFFSASLLSESATNIYMHAVDSLFPKNHFGHCLKDIKQCCMELLQYQISHPPQNLKDRCLYLFRTIKIYCFIKDSERYMTKETCLSLLLLCLLQIKSVSSIVGKLMMKRVQNLISSSEEGQKSVFIQNMSWLQDKSFAECFLEMDLYSSSYKSIICKNQESDFDFMSLASAVSEKLIGDLHGLCASKETSLELKNSITSKVSLLMRILHFLNNNCEEASHAAHFYSVYVLFLRYYAKNKLGIDILEFMKEKNLVNSFIGCLTSEIRLSNDLIAYSGLIQKLLLEQTKVSNQVVDLVQLVNVTHNMLVNYINQIDSSMPFTKMTVLCSIDTLLEANLILKLLKFPPDSNLSIVQNYFEELDILRHVLSNCDVPNNMWTYYSEKTQVILETNPLPSKNNMTY